jgi:predicted transcriptional regulator
MIHVRIDDKLCKRIDDLRHASQSRTEWINRVLLRAVVVAETSDEHGKIVE